MAEDARLQIVLEAKIDKLTAKLGEANLAVSRSMRRIDQDVQSANRSLNNLGSGHGKGLDEFSSKLGLNRNQLAELTHVARAAFDSIASGQSPLRVLAQEGARTYQALSSGKGGLAGGLAALPSLFNPVAAGLLTVAAATGGVIIAEQNYEAQERALQAALRGRGAASGATVGDLQDIAAATAQAGRGTTAFAEQAEAAFLRVGVQKESLAAAIAAVDDLAAVTGQKGPEALKALAAAADDPTRGFAALRDAGVDLTTQQLEQIRLLEEGKGNAAAFAQGLRDLAGASQGAADQLQNGFGRVLKSIGDRLSELPGLIGKAAYALTHRLSAAQEIAQLQQGITADKSTIFGGLAARTYLKGDIEARQRRIAELQPVADRDQAAADARTRGARARQSGSDAAATANELNPVPGQVADIRAKQTRLRSQLDAYTRTGDAVLLGGKTVAELREAIAKGDERIASLNKGPRTAKARAGRAGPADQTAALDERAQSAADAADRELSQAKAQLTTSIEARAELEKAAVDSDASRRIAALTKARGDILKSLNDANQDEQLEAVDRAITETRATAALKKELIDRQAEASARARRQAQEDVEAQVSERRSQSAAALATSAQARAEIELEAFHRHLTDETARFVENERAAAGLPGGDPAQAERNIRDRKAADQADLVAERTRQQRAINPLYDRAHPTTTVAEDLQGVEARRLDGLTDSLTRLVTRATDAKSAFKELITSMIADLARLALQRTVEQPLADLLFGSSKTGNLGNLNAGSGLVSVIGGLFSRHATGADSFGGLTHINEQGPEGVAFLPRNTQIIPNDTLRGLAKLDPAQLGRGGGAVHQEFHLHAEGAVMTDDLVRGLTAQAQVVSQSAAAEAVGRNNLRSARRSRFSRAI